MNVDREERVESHEHSSFLLVWGGDGLKKMWCTK